MPDFNKELISNVKIFQTENLEQNYEEKYCFIQYVFSNFQSIDYEDIEIIDEEFEELNSNIDAVYFDEDSSTINLYLAIYNDSIDDNAFLIKEEIQKCYDKAINFLHFVLNGKFSLFGESSFTYEVAQNIFSSVKQYEIVVNIVSNYNIPPSYKKDDIENISNIDVSFRTYDLTDLNNKFVQLTNDNVELDCNNAFGEAIPSIKIISTSDFDVYLFGMRGSWLSYLYKIDGERLLEQNVRSYLYRKIKVNAGIFDTVKNNPEEFVSFNNGISAVATGIRTTNGNGELYLINKILNFQIVNGGQTTATLYECTKEKLGDNLDKVIVPVKMTVIKNVSSTESFIRNISVFSNTQTAIKSSDPPSNLPFYVQIKELSRQCLSHNGDSNYICYFERTKGEYDTERRRNNFSKKFEMLCPKKMKFDKIDLAKAINCWEQLPYITCQGREKNFAYFNDVVKNQLTTPNETYFKQAYALVLIYRTLEKTARKLALTVKSTVVAYALALISYLYDQQVDLMNVWETKNVPPFLVSFAYDTMPKIHEIIIKASSTQTEPRMWARKVECWEKVKKVTCSIEINKTNNKVEFFTKNDALLFISNRDNIYNSTTWTKLLFWNNKYHVLNASQYRFVKFLRNVSDSNKSLTLKQIQYLQDIFVIAVKNGYKYN